MTLLTIRIEGGLLSPDFLETIHDQPGPEVWPMLGRLEVMGH